MATTPGGSEEMERKDWALLAVAEAGGRPVSPVKLQKSLFLLGQNLPDEIGEFYDFQPYNYGPFDAAVYYDAEQLAAEGLIAIEYRYGRRWPEYIATPTGIERAERIRRVASPRAVQYLGAAVDWAINRGFTEILRAIYARYPEYAKKSVFRDRR